MIDPRNKTTIQTYTGHAFDVLNPDPSSIYIEDIAHALSNVCRYTGHTRKFYSVAQHSVIVSEVVPTWAAFIGLMHDATEAYIADLARPVKRIEGLGEAYRQVEERLHLAITTRFGIHPVIPPVVHRVDSEVLLAEVRDLMAKPVVDSWLFSDLRKSFTPAHVRVRPWPSRKAERLFLHRFKELS